ncbi:trypsin-like cysteine/serine peptidase domain-containing protein [Sordaria brevicollis]|uniref:Trypsin-like cysteine/serine peptidase domain-containing protein n=1 Tax=Sordaria brevicollis TaxID=83679 RepID=A0AAE0PEC6_SORBR|nr:trypsin-like cysteine/serine peptidase domain-containing protein [Sordaria brevicollis]
MGIVTKRKKDKAKLETKRLGCNHRVMMHQLRRRKTKLCPLASWRPLCLHFLGYHTLDGHFCSSRPYADQLELKGTRRNKRKPSELLESIIAIAEQPSPKKKPRQQQKCRLPRSYRPRVGKINTTPLSSSNPGSGISPTTKQSINHSPTSTSPKSLVGFSSSSPSSSQSTPPPSQRNPKKLTLRPSRIHPLPPSLSSITTKTTQLSPTSHSLLLQKAARLSKYEPLIPSRAFRRHRSTTINATLAFAQSEAGTAFCVREDGLLLTAAHCIAEETEEREAVGRVVWLVMPVADEADEDDHCRNEDEDDGSDSDSKASNGCRRGLRSEKGRTPRSRIVGARCIAWDPIRDLALLKVTHAQVPPSDSRKRGAGSAIGHPSDEHPDDPPGIKAYGSEHRRILQLSSGRYLGIAPDKIANPHDNFETGAMRHDCWTYWGYSGGPIFERDSGILAGVHVDWNPAEPLVKRAVPWVAVEGFLEGVGFWG